MNEAILVTFLNKVAEPLFYGYDLTTKTVPDEAYDKRYRKCGRQYGEFIKTREELSSADLRTLARRMADGANIVLEQDPRIVLQPGSFEILINTLNGPFFTVAWTFYCRFVKKSWLRKNKIRASRETPEQEFERVTGSKVH